MLLTSIAETTTFSGVLSLQQRDVPLRFASPLKLHKYLCVVICLLDLPVLSFIGLVHPVNPRITAFLAYYVVDQPNLLLLVPGTLTPGRPVHTRFFHQYVNMHTHSLWPRWLRRAQVFVCVHGENKFLF